MLDTSQTSGVFQTLSTCTMYHYVPLCTSPLLSVHTCTRSLLYIAACTSVQVHFYVNSCCVQVKTIADPIALYYTIHNVPLNPCNSIFGSVYVPVPLFQ